MANYRINRRQLSILEGLAYWIADRAYFLERYSPRDPEFAKYDPTIRSLFDEADRAGVPWAVQNMVICWAEDWRQEGSEYITSMLDRRGVVIDYAARVDYDSRMPSVGLGGRVLA